MPPRKKEPTGPVPVEAFKHDDKRVNNPTADSGELLSPDVAQPKQLRYPRNPDLDPQLVWAGKDEQDGEDLVVDAPPIYIQEKIAPQVIIENLRKVVEKPELTLFDDFDGSAIPPDQKASQMRSIRLRIFPVSMHLNLIGCWPNKRKRYV